MKMSFWSYYQKNKLC